MAAGHTPYLGGDGKPDDCAYWYDDPDGYGGHNGFQCARCLDVVCVWCHDSGLVDIRKCPG